MISNPKTKHPSTLGADEHAPSFSAYVRRVQEIEAQLDREMAQVRLGAIRRECERANKEKRRGDELELQLAAMREEYKILKGIASMLLIGYPVLWLVTR
jgi:hypothetical protein